MSYGVLSDTDGDPSEAAIENYMLNQGQGNVMGMLANNNQAVNLNRILNQGQGSN